MKKPGHLHNILLLVLIYCLSVQVDGQDGDKKFSLGIYYDYTVSSRLYSNPRDADIVMREFYQTIDGLKSISFDIRYKISNSVSLGLGSGYMKSTSVFNPVEAISQSGPLLIAARDWFEMISLELSIVYELPVSTEDFKFFVGGGPGIYSGNLNRNINNLKVKNIEREYDLGIHVITGMDYLINDYIAVRGQMKFRDPVFEIKSEYENPSVIYEEEEVVIRQKQFWSKINVDGIIFSLGMIFMF